jgi:hypothetical protein
MKTSKIIILFFALIIFPSLSYGGSSKMKDVLINEDQAVKIAKEYLRSKQYNYEIDWEHPEAKLERFALKSDGSLSPHGLGKKIMVWRVRFESVQKTDVAKGIRPVLADVDAKTGEVFTKYSMEKL